MACSSIIALSKPCVESQIGGVEKLWLVAYKDLVTTGGTAGFTLTTGNTVSTITLSGSTKFQPIGLVKSTSGFVDTMSKDTSKGSLYYTTTLSLTLLSLSPENDLFIRTVQNQPVVAIYKARTGNYYVSGLAGTFELSSCVAQSGIVEGDLNGGTLGFSGMSANRTFMLDSTIVSSITA